MKTTIYDSDFFERFEEEINKNKNKVNSRQKDMDNTPYIGVAASSGYVEIVAYLLDRGANIYLLNDLGYNSLHEAVTFASNYINDSAKDVRNGYKIFRLLLNYEAEQRALYPKKYEKQTLLKDQENNNEMTPQTKSEKNKIISKELQEAIKEAEIHYNNCKIAKEQNIKITPYHKQFLPDSIKVKDELQNSPKIIRSGRDISDEYKWTTKIKVEETVPLVEKQDNKTNITNNVLGYFTNLFSSNNNSNGKVKTH